MRMQFVPEERLVGSYQKMKILRSSGTFGDYVFCWAITLKRGTETVSIYFLNSGFNNCGTALRIFITLGTDTVRI